MDLNQGALLVTAIASVALGIIVWQRTPDRVWNRLFAVYAGVGGVWTFSNFMIMMADDPGSAGLWLRISHPLGALSTCAYLDFAWTFPERIDYVDWRRRLVLYLLGVVFGTVAFAPDLVRSVTLEPGAIAVVDVEYGAAFVPFALFIAAALLYGDVVLLRKWFVLRGLQRLQLSYVLLGLACSHLAVLLTIMVIPLVWGTTAYSGWGAGAHIATICAMAYAIAKHRLMQPQAGLRRLASAVLASSAVAAGVLVVARLLQPYWSARGRSLPDPVLLGGGLIMGLAMVALYHRVHLALDTTAGVRQARRHAQTSATHILRTLDADELLDFLAQALTERLDAVRVVVCVKDEATGRFFAQARHGEPGRHEPLQVAADSLVARTIATEAAASDSPTPLSLDHIRRFPSLDEARALALEFEQLGAHLVAPMVWEDELVGLIVVGPKRSDDMYGDEDISFLSQMATNASLALSNASLYAQTARLKDFNESILREMDNAVVVTDSSGQVVVFNNAAERLFGIPVEQVEGASMELLPAGIVNCIRATLGTGRTLTGQHMVIPGQRPEGIPVACSVSPLRGNGSGASAAIAVVSDLTLTQELERERQEAERLSLIRVISAGMAHEIRNPLVAIRTFTELAPERMDDPEFRSTFLTVAQREIDRINKLVGDLLSLSKPADAVVEAVDVNEICQQVVSAVSGMAEQRSLNITLELGRLQGTPVGDAARIHQAVLNLVTNAIDEEPSGGMVRVTTERASGPRGEPEVVIRVYNANSYVPPSQMKDIFRPFYTNKDGGTGLGLAICQTIVEEHGGEITVSSSPSGGTEFAMRLPTTRLIAAQPLVGGEMMS